MDIGWINGSEPTVDYGQEARAGGGWLSPASLEQWCWKFEADMAETVRDCATEDIGGLMIYSLEDGVPVAVYDYELLQGWVRNRT